MEKPDLKNKEIKKPAQTKKAKETKAKLMAGKGEKVIESLTNRHMTKGEQYVVTDAIAEILVKAKKAKICK